jgi:phosphoenolpyruvate synthase/pyruvate phosphate dikinase
MPAPRAPSAPRASAFAAPSTCSLKATASPVREMILADVPRAAAARRWPSCCRCSAADFIELFEIMKGLPVTIRLLDPPLHEFLPKTDEEIAEVAGVMGSRSWTCCASAR